MPGRLRTNFRSGNLAEDLGVLLLRGIAAVADVPRSEDIGLDAIATLLRRDADGNCYAEDSFGVQLKSASEATLEYKDHGLDWFRGQSQPFLIGRVSPREAMISLYPTLLIHHATRAMHSTKAVVHFGNSTIPPMLAGYANSPWCGNHVDRDTVDIWLGEPLLEWNLSQLRDEKYLLIAYRALKRFLQINRYELQFIALNQASAIAWKTNEPESISSSFMMAGGAKHELQSVVNQCMPALQGLLTFSLATPNDCDTTLLGSVIGVIAALKEAGATIEAEDLFLKVGLHHLHRSIPKESDCDGGIATWPRSDRE